MEDGNLLHELLDVMGTYTNLHIVWRPLQRAWTNAANYPNRWVMDTNIFGFDFDWTDGTSLEAWNTISLVYGG